MDLALKIPRGKLPFIGILDDSFGKSYHFNNDLIKDHRESLFRLYIEVFPACLSVKLICDEKLIIRHYPNVIYNAEALKRWLYLTSKAPVFNFSQIYREYDKEIVPRIQPGNVPWVLKVEQVSIKSFDYSAFRLEEY